MGLQGAAFFLQVGQLLAELLELLLRAPVLFLLEGLPFDFNLKDPPLELIDLLGEAIDFDPDAGGGFIDQINGLVGQVAAGDIAVGEGRGGHQRQVLDPDAVVDLVFLLQSPQDRDGVFDRRLADIDLLEASFEGRIFFDVLLILVQRRGADAAKLSPGQRRLQHIGRVNGALRRAGADDGVKLIDEEDDLPFGFLNLFEDGFQAVFEFSAVFCPGHERPHIERNEPLVFKRLGDIAVGDPLSQSFDDGRFSHARLADENGIIFCPAGQDLDDPADLILAPDDRVELALPGQVGKIAGVFLEDLVLGLGLGIGDPLGSPDGFQRLKDGFFRDAVFPQNPACLVGIVFEHGQKQMFRRDILVLELIGLLLGIAHDPAQGRREIDFHALHFRHLLERRFQFFQYFRPVGADFGQQRADDVLLLGEETPKEMFGLDLLVPQLLRLGLGHLDGLLRHHGEFIPSHNSSP